MNLPRLYYTLPELAVKWGCTENDLLHMAATGELRLSVKHSGEGSYSGEGEGIELFDEYVRIYPDDAERILQNTDARRYYFSKAGHQGRLFHIRNCWDCEGPYPPWIWVSLDPGPCRVVVLIDDMLQAEAKHPQSTGRPPQEVAGQDEREQAHRGEVIYSIRGQEGAAKHLGVTARTIASYIKKKMPCLREANNKYRFNGEQITAWRDQHQECKVKKLCANMKK